MTSEVPVKEEMDMEQLLSEAAPESKAGSLVTAYVVEVSPMGLLVDVGLKVEGFIPMSETKSPKLSSQRSQTTIPLPP